MPNLPDDDFILHSFPEQKVLCDCGNFHECLEHIESSHRWHHHRRDTLYIAKDEFDDWLIKANERLNDVANDRDSLQERFDEVESERDYYFSECSAMAERLNARHWTAHNPALHPHVLWYDTLLDVFLERPVHPSHHTGEWFTLNTLAPISDAADPEPLLCPIVSSNLPSSPSSSSSSCPTGSTPPAT